MERPHSPKTPSSPAAADTLSALLEDLGAQPRDFDCIVTGDLGHIGSDLLLTLQFSADRFCAICIAAKSIGWCLRARVR